MPESGFSFHVETLSTTTIFKLKKQILCELPKYPEKPPLCPSELLRVRVYAPGERFSCVDVSLAFKLLVTAIKEYQQSQTNLGWEKTTNEPFPIPGLEWKSSDVRSSVKLTVDVIPIGVERKDPPSETETSSAVAETSSYLEIGRKRNMKFLRENGDLYLMMRGGKQLSKILDDRLVIYIGTGVEIADDLVQAMRNYFAFKDERIKKFSHVSEGLLKPTLPSKISDRFIRIER
ncbi:hypothetical protein HK098_002308 [Nowakowskiella sp. JEL0407]|nr:hypothetical protein HK098_002308 [Nowakowskiella sp. JEL0407]